MAMRVREVPFVPSQTIEIKLPVNKPYSKVRRTIKMVVVVLILIPFFLLFLSLE